MICELTNKKTIFGKNISHSNVKTNRKFKANIFRRKFYFESLKRNFNICLSHKGLRIINKFQGIENCIRNYKTKDQSLQIRRIRKMLLNVKTNNIK